LPLLGSNDSNTRGASFASSICCNITISESAGSRDGPSHRVRRCPAPCSCSPLRAPRRGASSFVPRTTPLHEPSIPRATPQSHCFARRGPRGDSL
jgi:hypothetical protein